MNPAPLSTPPSDTPRYVGFWARTLASIVDTVLLLFVLVPFSLLLFGDADINGPLSSSDPARFLIDTILPAMVVVLFWARKQATPGKMLVHARIVDAVTGAVPRPRQWLLRYAGYFLSTIALGLGFLWVAFDPRKQGWHDKLAGTVVVRDTARDAAAEDPQAP
jgi:uncharacterized RDD family membrane protein YckC